jgi:hypothetical protein
MSGEKLRWRFAACPPKWKYLSESRVLGEGAVAMNSESIAPSQFGPRARRWHLVTGSLVLTCVYLAGLVVLDWLTR